MKHDPYIVKLCLTDKGFLSPAVFAAAHSESYLALHNGRTVYYAAARWIGVGIAAVSLLTDIPAMALMGAGIAWWAHGRGR